jgi:hypothetical protein
MKRLLRRRWTQLAQWHVRWATAWVNVLRRTARRCKRRLRGPNVPPHRRDVALELVPLGERILPGEVLTAALFPVWVHTLSQPNLAATTPPVAAAPDYAAEGLTPASPPPPTWPAILGMVQRHRGQR